MEPTITLHKLRVFKEVVERQSLTLAAQELFVSQPVVSAHVRDLEEYFGSRLLYQHGRRMLLNEAGQAVYQYVPDILRSTADTKSIARLLDSADAGAAAIGASKTPGAYGYPSGSPGSSPCFPNARLAWMSGRLPTSARRRRTESTTSQLSPARSPQRTCTLRSSAANRWPWSARPTTTSRAGG